ncbi:MAG: hypothetical protein M1832_006136 [Thelocarpon impressellum]|nr:MAG: hypothetical protein M1832_006136 [Thelocarpon impressellum]
MSRRVPNPVADRAAQNQQTIKSLLKLEGNKSCADCKRNKHPRWASWNVGVFICIRCSGIHRSMGTHVSRVKSVDLDAWTDEQLQSVLRWGNTRANKYGPDMETLGPHGRLTHCRYWEAKLAPGHVPSEAKIENFIRTKYDSKRWVMEGGVPDPASLDDEGDEDVPLSVVQEKQKLDRSSSVHASSSGPPSRASGARPTVDLFGDDPVPAPRPATTEPAVTRPPPPRGVAAPAKQSKPGDSLLGLDFFGPTSSQAAAPSGVSTAGSRPQGPAAPSRPDLKQSILSLYASAPRQADPPAQPSQQASFSGLRSAPAEQQAAQQSSFGGLNDAFSGLSFGAASSSQAQAKPAAKPPLFANLGSFSQKSAPAAPSVGGGFFDTKPAAVPISPPLQQAAKPTDAFASSDDFGAFDSAPVTAPSAASKATPASSSSGLGDLFDFSSSPQPQPQPAPAKQTLAPSKAAQSSVFNLSAPAPAPAPSTHQKPAQTGTASTTAAGGNSDWSNAGAWGSNDVWSTPDTSKPTGTTPRPAASTSSGVNDFGWGGSSSSTGGNEGFAGAGGSGGLQAPPSPPKVSADEDFGGWSSSAPPATNTTSAPAKPAAGGGAGFGGSEDLFSNVWE